MITKAKLKQLAYCAAPESIQRDYKQAVSELIVSCRGDQALFDFNGIMGNGGTISQLLSTYAKMSLSTMIAQYNSDFVIQGSQKALAALGALQGLAIVYYPDESDRTVINKAMCTTNINIFNTLVNLNAIDGLTKGAEDRKVGITVNRLTVPTMKAVKGTKANVFKDMLYGNKNGELVYTGPLFKFGEVDANQNIALTYTNCNGIDVNTALFIPLSFYYIIEDIFSEVFTTESHKGMTMAALASSVENSRDVLRLLTNGNSTKGVWGSRPAHHIRSITLSPVVLRKVYGKETEEVYQKINKIKPQLGLSFPQMRYMFYDLRGAYDSYEPQHIDPLTFKALGEYSENQLKQDVQVIRKSSQYPKFILISIYRESVDKLMNSHIDTPSLWRSLSIPEDILANAMFGDEHKRYVYGAFKYSSSDLYTLMTLKDKKREIDNTVIFGNVDSRAKTKAAMFGVTNFKATKVTLAGDYDQRLATVKKALSTGVCFVDYANKKGGVTRHTLTNNQAIITRIYGSDYVAKYGSLKKRIDDVRYGIENAKDMLDLSHYITKTGIIDLAGIEVKDRKGNVIGINPPFPVISLDFEEFKASLSQYLDNLLGQSGITREQKDVPPEKQVVCGVSLAATPKSATTDIYGSADFFTYLEIGGITGLYILK